MKREIKTGSETEAKEKGARCTQSERETDSEKLGQREDDSKRKRQRKPGVRRRMGLRWRGYEQEERQREGLRGLGRGGPQPHVITVTGSALCAWWGGRKEGTEPASNPQLLRQQDSGPPRPGGKRLGGWEIEDENTKGCQLPHPQLPGIGRPEVGRRAGGRR